MLFSEVQAEVSLSKITRSRLNAGICVDYYIPSLNVIVEVNGIQHYQPSSFGKDSVDTMVQYSKQLNRDDKLRSICDTYGIKLVEIPYTYKYNQIMSEFTELKNDSVGN